MHLILYQYQSLIIFYGHSRLKLNYQSFTNVQTSVANCGHRGRDHMIVKFLTTCAISAYHH